MLCSASSTDNENVACPQSGPEEHSQFTGSSMLQSRRQVNEKAMSGIDRYRSTSAQESPRKKYGTWYSSLEQQVQPIEKEGVAVLIPGVGNLERAAQVETNLQWLKKQGVPFECWMYVWKPEKKLPLDASRFAPCQLIRHPGFWMDHILALPLNMTKKPAVIHMMDSSEPQPDVNLSRMLSTMVVNGLGALSPTFNDTSAYTAGTYPSMFRQPDRKTGRFVDFIELHFVAFSRKYFACLQDHIDPENPLGWGFDLLLPSFCGGSKHVSEINVGRMGLMDQMTMVKKKYGSYSYDKASKGMRDFVGKHPGVPHPEFVDTGELKAPEDIKPSAPLLLDKLPTDVEANATTVPLLLKENSTLAVDWLSPLGDWLPIWGGSAPLDGKPDV